MVENSKSEIFYPYMGARELPIVDRQCLIDRSAIINKIVDLFTESDVVFLQSEEGLGATTTSLLFCEANPNNSISIFIKPSSKISYSPDSIRILLAEQYSWLLDGKKYEKDIIDEAEFNSLQLRLRRKVTNKFFLYFVIDGLHQISKQDRAVLETIFKDILPTGLNHFKFLVVGKQDEFQEYFYKVSHKYFYLIPFSQDETRHYLSDIQLEQDEVSTIFNFCLGIPGRLASVRRLLANGLNVKQIFETEPSKYPEFIKLELKEISELADNNKLLFAIIAFSNRELTIHELSEISKFSVDEIESLLKKFSFLQKNVSTNVINFITDSHRNIAANTLVDFKKTAIELQISFLKNNPQTHVSLSYLPTYYNQIGSTQQLITLLNNEHFSNLLSATKSIIPLKSHAELGLNAAIRLKNSLDDIFSFSLKKSLFSSIARIESLVSEINALVAIGNLNEAMQLAQSATLREDRFSLLCVLANQLIASEKNNSNDLKKIIKELSETIEFGALGDRAIDMAISLVNVDAALALSIVDKVTKVSSNIMDRDSVFARVTIEAISDADEEQVATFNEATKSILDEKIHKFSEEVGTLISNLSASSVIDFANKLQGQRKILFLCLWSSIHKHEASSLTVVDHALSLMIQDATYMPKMRNLRDLSYPLLSASHTVELENLINRIDIQSQIIKGNSISTDLVSLQAVLARAELSFNPSKASKRFQETYDQLSNIDNIDVKLECYAILLVSLKASNLSSESQNKLYDLILLDFKKLFNEILDNSADQYSIIKGTFKYLIDIDYDLVIDMCEKLNTLVRRNLAYEKVCYILTEKLTLSNLKKIEFILQNKIVSKNTKYVAVSNIFNSVITKKRKLENEVFLCLKNIYESCEDPDFICSTYSNLVEVWFNSGRISDISVLNLSKFNNYIDYISSDISKIDYLFSMAAIIARFDIELAKEYYEKGRLLREKDSYLSRNAIRVLSNLLCLSTRAFAGLFLVKSTIEADLERFFNLLDFIPNQVSRIDLCNELACKAYVANRMELTSMIIQDKCLPVIDDIKNKNKHLAGYLVKMCYPSIFITSQNLAARYIQLVDESEQDAVKHKAIDLILKKETRHDPNLEVVNEQSTLNYINAELVCGLIETLNDDVDIYYRIDDLCKSISSKKNKDKLTQVQRNDLANRLSKFIDDALPDQKNIKHNGYKILSEAAILTIKDNTRIEDWNILIGQGRNIPNVADAGFVLLSLIELIPKRWEKLIPQLRMEIIGLSSRLLSATDKIDRMIQISDTCKGNNEESIAKDQLRSAMLLTLQYPETNSIRASQQSIIDTAEKISVDFAHELIELIDDDPARKIAKEEAKQHLSMLKVKKDLANNKDNVEIKNEYIQHLPSAAWKNVGALLSGRLQVKNPENFVDSLKKSSYLSFFKAYPILTWYIDNFSKKYSKLDGQSHKVSLLLNEILSTAELMINILQSSMAKKVAQFYGKNDGDLALIGLTNRDNCLDFISNWLSSCRGKILFCDPYFTPEDIDFFKLVLENCPDSELTILTSTKNLLVKNALTSDAFLDKWKEEMDQDPPLTKIIGIADDSLDKKTPLHDRWLISGQKGISIGTSFNSIGTGKLSSVSNLENEEVSQISHYLNKFVNQERMIDGKKIQYQILTL